MMPIIEVMERARRGRLKVCISMPPRHGKTETILSGIAWWLLRNPGDTCAYASYNQDAANSKSKVARERALQAGVKLDPKMQNLIEWRTTAGGGLLAGKGLTGKGAQGLIVVDDPFADREDADSEVKRQNVWEWFTTVAYTRREGASVIIVQTRWHMDDLIGRCMETKLGFEYVNLPAYAEENDPLGRKPGELLWPIQDKAEEIAEAKIIDPYNFEALYQGRPRPRGHRVFADAHFYDPAQLGRDGWRGLIVADPAASEKTTADYSAAGVILARGRGAEMEGRLVRMVRAQVTVPAFVRMLMALQQEFGFPVAVESVAGFKAIPQMLREMEPNLQIKEIVPVGDKFTRSQPVSAAWNQGRFQVPMGNPPWLKDFLHEVGIFTGVNDRHDDQVDVLANGWNALTVTGPVYNAPKTPFAPRRI